jgi:hypothetical protein
MPLLAAALPGTSTPIALQLVLLPPCASDVTAATPAVRVIDLAQGVTVQTGGKKERPGQGPQKWRPDDANGVTLDEVGASQRWLVCKK